MLRSDMRSAAKRYYAEWLDVSPVQFDTPGAVAVPSEKRKRKQAGYSRIFNLYCFVTNQRAIISFSPDLHERIPILLSALESELSVESLRHAITESFHVSPASTNKYYYTDLPLHVKTSSARQLLLADFDQYRKFFYAQHPKVEKDNAWLREYFVSLTERGYSFGVFVDERIVCATDAPDIPYMSDLIVEPGINTLVDFRRRGFAKSSVGAMIEFLLSRGKVPVWSCGSRNVASARLAVSLGFQQLGTVISLTHPTVQKETFGP